eukprot:TRINITY_DN35914_c0_g1_i1.p1 TRINITY_DN35914_c0_g1~~TRINITY_DN35914_c0_g1_i1.p1  ORF type:complete len:144 (-),score=29.65 TRINITY_DN35914_c0_g1_i1:35-466(-)
MGAACCSEEHGPTNSENAWLPTEITQCAQDEYSKDGRKNISAMEGSADLFTKLQGRWIRTTDNQYMASIVKRAITDGNGETRMATTLKWAPKFDGSEVTELMQGPTAKDIEMVVCKALFKGEFTANPPRITWSDGEVWKKDIV